MAELNRRNIHDVANAFHFSTVERVLTLVMSSGLRETYRPLGALAEELMRRFNIEDAAYKRSQKNFASDDIKALDTQRDKYAQFLKTVLTAYTTPPVVTFGTTRPSGNKFSWLSLLQKFNQDPLRRDDAAGLLKSQAFEAVSFFAQNVVEHILNATINLYPTIVRCHRAFLVNLCQVEQVISRAGAMQLVICNYQEPVPVSRSNVTRIKEAIKGMSDKA